jgi:hypothetical protein
MTLESRRVAIHVRLVSSRVWEQREGAEEKEEEEKSKGVDQQSREEKKKGDEEPTCVLRRFDEVVFERVMALVGGCASKKRGTIREQRRSSAKEKKETNPKREPWRPRSV